MKFNLRSVIRKSSTAQEAVERRDTAIFLALGCLAVAILFTVVSGLTRIDLFESMGMIMAVAAVGFFALWYFVRKDVHRLQNIFCQCGERFLFPGNVSYEIKGEQVSSGKSSDGKGVTSHISTTVTLCCKCQKCGTLHTFDSVFVTEKKELNEHGVVVRTKAYPLNEQLTDFFNK